MRSSIILLGAFAPLFIAFGQTYQVSQGPGYASAVYLDLNKKETTAVDLTAWDIAFNVGGRSSAVLVNEGIASSQKEEVGEVELYASSATDFATADTSQITGRHYNDEADWEGGAFNQAATPGDPLDLGWGSYSPATQTVVGSRVFFVRTRDGVYHTVRIESLAGGSYTFIHSPYGTDGLPDTVVVDKSQYAGKTLAYFSFSDGLLDLEPASWDLLFTRYSTPLAADPNDTLDYTVTGVLQNQGVSVAELNGVDPATVEAPADDASYSDSLTTIGYDWKDFDLNSFQYSIPDDRVYFVRTPDSTYRLRFIDFEGSSTGTSTFTVAGEVGTTAITAVPAWVTGSQLYPNPAPEWATLEITAERSVTGLSLTVLDAAGRRVHGTRVRALNVGENRLQLPLANLPAGHYFARLTGPGLGVLTHHFIKQ